MKSVISIFLVSIVLSGCPDNNNSNKSVQEMTFETIYKDNLYGGTDIFEPKNFLFNMQDEWKSFLTKLDTENKVSDQFDTSIDFSKYTVVAIIDELRNTGGFSIEVSKIIDNKEQIMIMVKNLSPQPTDMVTMTINQPFHIIKINKTDKEIAFISAKE